MNATFDLATWLANQAPAIVLLCVAVSVLWRTLQKTEGQATETKEWRDSVRSKLADIDQALIEQSLRISQIEYLVGLMRGRNESVDKN